MNRTEENLVIAGIEIPNGGTCLGTKVKQSNGKYLSGITSITMHADVDTRAWGLTLELMPEFMDQEVIQVVLESCKVAKRLKANDRKQEIEKQVKALMAEHAYLGKYDETTNTQAETTDTESTKAE